MSIISDNIRNGIIESDLKRDVGLTTPEDIVRYDNIPYGENNMQILDVYKPKNCTLKKLPVIVSVHGGGWVYGHKESYQFYCMSLAQEGFAVVNFSYRHAPEHKFPAFLEDTCIVFNWVLTNSAKFGFDVNNIFAVGDSAGGHILSLFMGLCVNEDYRKNFDFAPPKDFVPRAIALNCGAYQPLLDDVSDITPTKALIAEFLENKGTQEELDLINSLKYICKGFPPTFVMTCDGDFLKNQFLPIIQKLMDLNVPYVARYYVTSERVLEHDFHCNIKSDSAVKCNKEECNFFKQNIATN